MIELLTDEAKQFINQNIQADVATLALKTHRTTVPMGFLLNQIQCRQKLKEKLPLWYANDALVYPFKLAVEQCSSSLTADYKAGLLNGEKIVDITGGLGVDAMAFTNAFEEVVHVERNSELSECVAHNARLLTKNKLTCICQDGINYVSEEIDTIDCIYIDPARRDQVDQRVFRFQDCDPNVLLYQDLFFQKAKQVLIKASPLIDIKQSLKELKNVREVHVVSVKNDCKEVLFLLEKGCNEQPIIKAIDLPKKGIFSFTYEEETTAKVVIDTVEKFIYLPHVALTKAAPFKLIAARFALKKVHRNTHVYTSSEKVIGFPGRTFELIDVVNYSTKVVRKLGIKQANLITRNFIDTTAAMRKKLGLKDGGDYFLIGITNKEGFSEILITKKIIDQP